MPLGQSHWNRVCSGHFHAGSKPLHEVWLLPRHDRKHHSPFPCLVPPRPGIFTYRQFLCPDSCHATYSSNFEAFTILLYSLFYMPFCELGNLDWQYSDSLSSTNLKDILPGKKVLIHLDRTEHISYIPKTPKTEGRNQEWRMWRDFILSPSIQHDLVQNI